VPEVSATYGSPIYVPPAALTFPPVSLEMASEALTSDFWKALRQGLGPLD